LLLLVLHVSFLAIFAVKWLRACRRQTGRFLYLRAPLTAEYVTYVLFASNMIGIIFARTLHYQFYSWYFHTLPMILWQTNARPWLGRLVILALSEYAFNVFPATPQSSLALQLAHVIILGQLLLSSSGTPQIMRVQAKKY
jgi:alpha-1,3-mannosyltransferase